MEPIHSYPENSLRAHLSYDPQPLKFGTSGRRGEVIYLTQLEVYINALADIEYLQSLPASEGGIRRGDDFYFAYDLRPSSTRFVPGQQGRGELAQAVVQAIEDAGMHPINLGEIPTPALMCFAVSRKCGSIMVTGSHIPFDRNGFKTNTATRELLKEDEIPITQKVAEVRERVYRLKFEDSHFDSQGRFRSGHRDLITVSAKGRSEYLNRYLRFFGDGETKPLATKRLLVYQHSAVGRDFLLELLEGLGAEVIPAGRSETFVPIDTENIDAECLATIQSLLDEALSKYGAIDAIVSTDGDSDCPLILGVTPEGKARFFFGDLLGMVVAEYLGADAVVVPVSCNDAIDRSTLQSVLEPKTRIGSPYVVAGMEKAKAKGRRAVCGWEANGGFLLGSDVTRNGKMLTALPTRDAMLPILGVLFSAQERGLTLPERFDLLPKRFSGGGLIKNMPKPISQEFIASFLPSEIVVQQVTFSDNSVRAFDASGGEVTLAERLTNEIEGKRSMLNQLLESPGLFENIVQLNYADGVRATDARGGTVHLRPSGNADEFRLYTVADTSEQAQAILQHCMAKVEAVLRRRE